MAAQSRGVNCDLAREIGATIANELRTDASERHKHKGSAGGTRRASIDTASTRADELMRSHRVTRRRKTRKAKSDAMDVQKQDRQVAIFLDACKAFEAATTEVTKGDQQILSRSEEAHCAASGADR